MTDNPLVRPQATAGDKWDLKNEGMKWLGSLFLIVPKELKPEWKSGNNNYEPTDCIVADVIAVTGPDAGRSWMDTFILSKGIVFILRDKIGDPVPGVLGRKATQNGEGWTLVDAQSDQEWDAMCAQVMPVWQQYQQGQFKRAKAAPAAAGAAAGAATTQQGWQQDAWGGLNAQPAPPPQAAAPAAGWNQGAPPATPPAPTAPGPTPGAAGADPNIAKLINNGLNPQQVMAMDEATRAAIAATY